MKGGDILTGTLKNNSGRNHVVKMRLNDTEYNTLCFIAKESRSSKARTARESMIRHLSARKGAIKLSDADRDKLLDVVMNVLNTENELLSEFSRVGNNLNQLARLANTYESIGVVTPEKLADLNALLGTSSDKLGNLDGSVTELWRRLV